MNLRFYSRPVSCQIEPNIGKSRLAGTVYRQNESPPAVLGILFSGFSKEHLIDMRPGALNHRAQYRKPLIPGYFRKYPWLLTYCFLSGLFHLHSCQSLKANVPGASLKAVITPLRGPETSSLFGSQRQIQRARPSTRRAPMCQEARQRSVRNARRRVGAPATDSTGEAEHAPSPGCQEQDRVESAIPVGGLERSERFNGRGRARAEPAVSGARKSRVRDSHRRV